MDGMIRFAAPASLPVGWYMVSETYVPGSIAESVFELADPLYIYYDGEAVTGHASNFDYDAKYAIINGYGNAYIKTLEL